MMCGVNSTDAAGGVSSTDDLDDATILIEKGDEHTRQITGGPWKVALNRGIVTDIMSATPLEQLF